MGILRNPQEIHGIHGNPWESMEIPPHTPHRQLQIPQLLHCSLLGGSKTREFLRILGMLGQPEPAPGGPTVVAVTMATMAMASSDSDSKDDENDQQ